MSEGAALSAMAAKVLVEGCLDNVSGAAKGQFPVGGRFLSDQERIALGLQPGGETMHYAVGDNAVYLNIQGASSTVWFNGDSSTVLAEVEKALRQRYPKAVQRKDEPVPTDEFTRRRSYDVPLTADRAAVLDVGYPAPGAGAGGFVGRVRVYARKVEQKN
jgi:hypothetical protein